MDGAAMMSECRRYHAIGYDELPELRRAIRDLAEPFRVADVLRELPAGMRDIEPRELGRALLSRGLCVSVGYDDAARCMMLERFKPRRNDMDESVENNENVHEGRTSVKDVNNAKQSSAAAKEA